MFFVVYYNTLSVQFNLDNFYIFRLQGGQLATRGRCHGVAWTVTGNGKLGPHHPHTGLTWAGKLVILFLSWMQCCGSVTFWYGSWSWSCYFLHWPSKWQHNFLLISSWSYIYIIFQRCHRTAGNQGFSYYFFGWRYKDPDLDPYLWLTDSNADPGGPKTYGYRSATLLERWIFG